MATNISNTKYYKKGEKLPDGTTAKRNIVWDTKNNRRVTGTVTVSTVAGVAAKKYKGGRSVVSIKKAAAKKAAANKPSNNTGPKTPPSGPSAAEKARLARLQQNKGVKAGTMRVGAAGKTIRKYDAKTGKWNIVRSGDKSAMSYLSGTKAGASKPSTKPKNKPSTRATAQAAGTPTAAYNKPSGSRYGTGWANAAFGPGGAASGVGRAVGTAGSYLFGRTESGMVWNGSKWVKKK